MSEREIVERAIYTDDRLELYQKTIALHKEGFGRRRIAKMLGVPEKAGLIGRWLYSGNKPRPKPDLTPSPELAYVIGATLGDGTVYKGGRNYTIRLDVNDKDFAEEYHRCLLKVAKRKVNFWYQKKTNRWLVATCCKPLYLFFKEGLKHFQNIINEYPEWFIRGFADAEGCANFRGSRHKTVRVEMSNTNHHLLMFIQSLLRQKFGIYSRISEATKPKSGKICYKVIIDSQINNAEYARLIGFTISRKMNRLNVAIQNVHEMSNRLTLYNQAKNLHKKGHNYATISRLLNVNHETVRCWINTEQKPIGYEDRKKITDLVVSYTKEYRDAHWIPCTLYGLDPRTCGSLHFGKICGRDNRPCNAEWTGDKDP